MLTFLKLGGSLITDKARERQLRTELIDQIAREIKEATTINPDLQLLVGHGSGSFGHVSASLYNTRSGVNDEREWDGFTQVWYDARTLNQYLVEAFYRHGLKCVAFPASALCLCNNHNVADWQVEPLKAALTHDIMPLINGDVVFDKQLGGTILSTEEQFVYLARHLKPERVLIAGKEEGVWADYPNCKDLIPEINSGWINKNIGLLGGSSVVDVTGGMRSKVEQMSTLITENPGTSVLIFSGEIAGNIKQSLLGENPGTIIKL